MFDVAAYLRRVAERSGFRRTSYVERNLPTQPSNVVVVPFYGDLHSTWLLSTFLLKPYKESHPDKYVVLCSWPGVRALFPYVDEVWCLGDESVTKTLALQAQTFYNDSTLAGQIVRGLTESADVVSPRDWQNYYHNGFTSRYLEEFGGPWRHVPEVPSATMLLPSFQEQLARRPQAKVTVFPACRMRSRQGGRTVNLPVSKEFWAALVERLLAEGIEPVIVQNWFTHDLSPEFADRLLYLAPREFGDILAAFHHIGCVVDVHTGISRLALSARSPFLAATERAIYVGDREYEADELCGLGVPQQYIFSFSTMLMAAGPEEWRVSVLDTLVIRLRKLLAKGRGLPPTAQSYQQVSLDLVQRREAARRGIVFLNLSKKR